MAQKYAIGLLPFTAARAGESVMGHVSRHMDKDTAKFLFPDGTFPPELEVERKKYRSRFARQKTLPMIVKRSNDRQLIWERPDVAALYEAYRATAGRPGPANDRLIGSILLHAIVTARHTDKQLERKTVKLNAGEVLFKKGDTLSQMYVLLSATSYLSIQRESEGTESVQQVGSVSAPHVLGIMGMWRGQPEVSTIFTRDDNELEVIVIDAERFSLLSKESGFQAAIAEEVRRRLSLNATMVSRLLSEATKNSDDPLLNSIQQLFCYLSGDSHTALDKVIDCPVDASTAEYVETLRLQVNAAIKGRRLPPELQRCLMNIIWYL
jgi:CRP-like cAMP-binding protein